MMFVCGDIFDFPSDPTVFPKCDSIGPMNHTVLISYRSCCYKIILQLESAFPPKIIIAESSILKKGVNCR
jgi:hypothetical protein